MHGQRKTLEILMGNEAIGRGLIDNGCSVITSYPGTPASEILAYVARRKKQHDLPLHVEWSVNEKAAYEVALTNSYMGGRSAVAMKQVGLNVAADPLMSSAYTGVTGGFVIVSADDPGPHSSQTEQDSRLMAMLAKIPVLDPASPREALAMTATALDLSERYSVPVMLRSTTRVCHARQDVRLAAPRPVVYARAFEKNPRRWAATPKFRYELHRTLNRTMQAIARRKTLQPALHSGSSASAGLGLIASGVAWAYCLDILDTFQLHDRICLYKVPLPYPVNTAALSDIVSRHERVLVVEETCPVIELQIPDRRTVLGKTNGAVPAQGELTPDVLVPVISSFAGRRRTVPRPASAPGRRPSLCPGCPHRASFFAIRTAVPTAVYPGDIGCYTLGVNMGVVDTCLCMGASINQAAGFFHAWNASGAERKSVVATIGDSTFIHSGTGALINAVYHNARFVLVILDNATTAMTGNQPTAATGVMADGTPGTAVSLETIVRGCGVASVVTVDPYDIEAMIAAVRAADALARSPDGGIAVVIARRPCLMNSRVPSPVRVHITDACTKCGICTTRFECPAISDTGSGHCIDQSLCSGCGVCVQVCPSGAIQVEQP